MCQYFLYVCSVPSNLSLIRIHIHIRSFSLTHSFAQFGRQPKEASGGYKSITLQT